MTRTEARAFALHAVFTGLVALLVATISSSLVAATAADMARRGVAAVADAVAHAVVVPFRMTDFAGAGEGARERILAGMESYMDEGVIERVKLWRVDGDEVVVLFSDEMRIEGVRRPFDADLAARLDAGEVVVLDIPDDPEHQFEYGTPGLVEAFIGFEDATGAPMRLELYLPTEEERIRADLLGALLPIVILGPLALGLATLPLALRLARRLAQREAERRALLHTALAASDRERAQLAARLHDGVIQDLASVGLALDSLGRAGGDADRERTALLDRASSLLETDLADLRSLLSELAPPDFEGSLEAALRDLADDLGSGHVRIRLDLAPSAEIAPESGALLYRVTRELIRNATEHGRPETVTITLRHEEGETVIRVFDDGRGFDVSAPAPEGHFGLALIRQALTDNGGRIRMESGPGGTRAEVRLPVMSTLTAAESS